MSVKREIKFTTTPSKTRLTEGTVCYQGQLKHNRVLDVAETRRLFAQRVPMFGAMSGLFLDELGSFMQEMAAEGYHADFGPFAMGLKMRGSFPASNAPFDGNLNSVGVELMPGAAVKKAVSALKPLNVTCEKPCRLTAVYQETPCRMQDAVLAATEHRTISATGRGFVVHPEAEDEGAWIENDAGDKLLACTVVGSELGYLTAALDGALEAGTYWFVVAGRLGNAPELRRAGRRLTAV